ncbi:hypothetical protein K0B70_24170, partial [Salmonella enterica subsp. enterica serovar Reading]|nr:hypothetical protein [Salmonella enterica subsp. enterica serovar Reading]
NPVTGDPTLRSPRVNTNQLQTERTAILQWRSPWVKLSEAAPAGNQLHTVTSDLLNNFYHDRTFPNKGDTPLLSYDEFNGIVSDTSGSYVFFGEKVQR